MIVNARVHTMDSGTGPAGGTVASAVCITNITITAVGDASTAEACTGPGTRRSAAWQLGAEDQLGSIAPGKRADLILLDRDIFRVDPFTIAEGRSLLTLVNGKVVHADPMFVPPRP
ncbi:MAG: amidohydrolase family protein [Sandaracinobacter sp.]